MLNIQCRSEYNDRFLYLTLTFIILHSTFYISPLAGYCTSTPPIATPSASVAIKRTIYLPALIMEPLVVVK